MANPGTLVEYVHNKKLLCALCLSQDRKEQLHVRTEENREDRVAKSKLIFVSNESLAPDQDHQRITEWLRQAAERRQEWSRQVALEELWELTLEEEGPITLKDLANLQFNQPSSEQTSGLYRALESDRLWFVRKGQDYSPRPAEQVQEIRQRMHVEEEKGRERELVGRWLRALWNQQKAVELDDKVQARYLTWIRDVALQGNEASRFKEIQALFKELDISGKDAAFKMMLKAGLWEHDEFLQLHRVHPPIEFSSQLVAEAEGLQARFEETLLDPLRVDESHLEALTIDDEWTSEVDDALTLEVLEDGYRVGIHIAEPSALVEPGSLLDEEALERGTTIYLPERKIRMMPDILGDVLCSLNQGELRPAFSYLITLDQDFQVTAQKFQQSKIRVQRRLTYQQADAMLGEDSDPVLAQLYKIALALRQVRQAAGAITLPFPRANIRVDRDDAGEPVIQIHRDPAEAPAQVLVSEMMIWANRISGQYFAEHEIPAVFRSQPDPEKPIPPDVDPAPENLHKLRRLMKKGEVSLKPSRHAGLGLEAYSQSTSPIRRYVDLIAQRQLKAHLRGETLPYSLEALEPMLARLERVTHQAEQLERERKQYWTLRYLEQRRWAEMDAVVLQNLPDKHLVQILPVLYETDCPQVPRKPLPPGTRLKVKIEMVFPREQSVRVTPILEDED